MGRAEFCLITQASSRHSAPAPLAVPPSLHSASNFEGVLLPLPRRQNKTKLNFRSVI